MFMRDRAEVVAWPLILTCLTAAILSFCAASLIGGTRAGVRLGHESMMSVPGAYQQVLQEDYSAGAAIFTRTLGASLQRDLGREVLVEKLDLAVFNYGKGRNEITIAFDRGEPVTVVIDPRTAGRHSLSVDVSPRLVRRVTVTPQVIGQETFVFDHLTLYERGASGRYLVMLGTLALLLGALLVGARALVIAPEVSSGLSFAFIDMLRGLAAILVLLHHTQVYAEIPAFTEMPWFGAIVRAGHLGVEVFFFVSAYTLTLGFLATPTTPTLSGFWLRRLARIVPAFFFAIAAMMLIRDWLYLQKPPVSGSTLAEFLSMTYVFDTVGLNTIIKHSAWWSISTEMQFYVLLPLFLIGLRWMSSSMSEASAKTARLIVAALLFIVGLVIAARVRTSFGTNYWVIYTLAYHADVFAGGTALALWYHGVLSQPRARAEVLGGALSETRAAWVSPMTIIVWSALIFAIVMIYSFSHEGVGPFAPGVRLRLWLILGLSILVVISHELERAGWFRRTSLLRTVGVLSFVVYLVHVPVLQLSQRFFTSMHAATPEQAYVVLLMQAFAGIIIAALVVHRLIEAPTMRIVRSGAYRAGLTLATQCYIAVMVWGFIVALLRLAK